MGRRVLAAVVVVLVAVLLPTVGAAGADAGFSAAGPVAGDAGPVAAPAVRAAVAAVPERVAGADRFATSVAIAGRSFPGGADTVYLARGDAFADALAAGTLTDGPVLLVPSCGDAPAQTAPEIARLDPDTVIALGGRTAVCDELLTTLADGRTTGRLAADDRFGTAAAIAARAFPDGAEVVYVANAADSPDAVAGGALTDGPILLVPSDGVPPQTVTATVEQLDPGTVVALGGTNAVADATLAAAAAGRPTARVAGASRFDTAAAIADRAFPTTGNPATVYLARGDVFADAVASGSLTDGPVLLVGSCGPLPSAATDYLTRADAATVAALGGTQAICDQTLTDAAALPGDDGPEPTPSPQPTPSPTPDPPEPTPEPPAPTPTPDDEYGGTLYYTWNSDFFSYDLATTFVTTRFSDLGVSYSMTPDGSQYLWEDDDVVTWHDTVTNQQIDATTLPPVTGRTTGALDAEASPNGEFVAFQEFDIGAENYERFLAVVDRAGNDALGDDDDPETTAAIAGTTASADGYAWSPQGELYFGGTNPDTGAAGLFRLNADLETFESIAEFPSFDVLPSNLAVSPDGTQLVYTYLQHLHRLDVATGEQVQLTTSNSRETHPTFSPDGRHIAFKLPDGSIATGFGTAYVIPNGDYPTPVRIEQADSPGDVPADAPYDVLFDDEGRGLVIDSDIYWFPTP